MLPANSAANQLGQLIYSDAEHADDFRMLSIIPAEVVAYVIRP